jgi:3-methyladenine DNA glycosylase AlkC
MASKQLKNIESSRLKQLNEGHEAKNLGECLAVDQARLARAALVDIIGLEATEKVVTAANQVSGLGITRQLPAIGRAIYDSLTSRARPAAIEKLQAHGSDTIRAWALYAALNDHVDSLSDALCTCKVYAKDAHFGVREWAWLAVRPAIASDIRRALSILETWVLDPHPYVRRFAVESTRPRGVWAQHITLLKKQPELAEGVITPLANEQDRYVQDSLANWINDASKTRPDWAKRMCVVLAQSSTGDVSRIKRRALRTIG